VDFRSRLVTFAVVGTKNVKRLPGFRDFAPEELAVRNRVFDAWRRVSRRFGFQEYDGPPLEPVDLYVRKSGAEILGQLYEFNDKGDRHIALRPEMTPSLARILAERSRAMPKPIRWFSMPQLFRYERQQKGRLREHYQWNVDIVGEAGPAADAEVLAVALEGLRDLGLSATDVVARVSDRPLIQAILEAMEIGEEHHATVFRVVDKLERAGDEWAVDKLGEVMSAQTATALIDTLKASDLALLRDQFTSSQAVVARIEAVEEYLARLDALGLGEWIRFDLTIVRGLAYYTGLVFEVFDRSGTHRAICGGGRYDRLLEMVGGDALPAVGFGMGDVVLTDLLRDLDLMPAYARAIDVFVVVQSRAERTLALEIAAALRLTGHSVSYSLADATVRKQFKVAATAGAALTLMLGPDEVSRGVGRMRDMESGNERDVPLERLKLGEGATDG
jgi:histidyl-tRNA synthetase